MEPMVVNFTTEASRLAVRAVAGLLLLTGFWIAGVIAQRVMVRLERAGRARSDVLALLGQTCSAWSPRSARWA